MRILHYIKLALLPKYGISEPVFAIYDSIMADVGAGDDWESNDNLQIKKHDGAV